jgi:hypothetical protein
MLSSGISVDLAHLAALARQLTCHAYTLSGPSDCAVGPC